MNSAEQLLTSLSSFSRERLAFELDYVCDVLETHHPLVIVCGSFKPYRYMCPLVNFYCSVLSGIHSKTQQTHNPHTIVDVLHVVCVHISFGRKLKKKAISCFPRSCYGVDGSRGIDAGQKFD